MKQVRLLVSDRWVRAASKRALEGVNEGLLQRCAEAERLENKETLQSSAAKLAMASVQNHREEVGYLLSILHVGSKNMPYSVGNSTSCGMCALAREGAGIALLQSVFGGVLLNSRTCVRTSSWHRSLSACRVFCLVR